MPTIYAASTDGYVRNLVAGGPSWATVRDATSGNSASSTSAASANAVQAFGATAGGGRLAVWRSFFAFDVSGISTAVASATINIRGTSASDADTAKTDIQSKNQKILYIEDNYQNLKLVEHIFEQRRQQVKFLSAMHPRDGIQLARTHRPDIILMDIQLPDMDGIAAFRELQKFQETRDIPVIALTAQAMDDDIRKALNSGFRDYVVKPLDIQVFLAKIDKILNP